MSFPPATAVRYAESLRFINAACFTLCPWTGPYPNARTAKWRLTAHQPDCPMYRPKAAK